ncbi:MAG: hypothetical protein PSV22_05310 [Pseudolabrys sp.]|nr:hypothetical protein [Pseudolabrys sp.]
MISERKIRANRANARASTGPRTAGGKARASRNAKWHGLTLSVLADPSLAAELQNHATLIAGEAASAGLTESACRIAAAQVDLVRVRQVRHRLLVASEIEHDSDASSEPGSGPHQDRAVIPNLEKRLAALDRYERRAISRRKRAIREYDLVRATI